jgi:hypothetical protein
VIENSIIDTVARVFLLIHVAEEKPVESLTEHSVRVSEFSITHALRHSSSAPFST